MRWEKKSESNLETVWVQVDRDGKETGAFRYEYHDGRLVKGGPPARRRIPVRRWATRAAIVAGPVVVGAEVAHRLLG